MARIDLERVVVQFEKALHQELIAYKLGPLGPEASTEPNTTFLQFQIVMPLEASGAKADNVKRAAWEMGASVRNAKASYLARMPMPEEGDARRCDNEDHGLSVLVQFQPGDPLYPFGALVFNVVGVSPQVTH